jgi:hypothetical protein
LLLARYGQEAQPQKMLPKITQEMLAEMIGATRSRVNLFMNIINSGNWASLSITAVRLKVEENQLVGVFGEIGVRVDGLKSA